MGLFLLPAHVAAEIPHAGSRLIVREHHDSVRQRVVDGLDGHFRIAGIAGVLRGSICTTFFSSSCKRRSSNFRSAIGFHLPKNRTWSTPASSAQEGGLLLAAPVAFCLFLTTVVLALMTRAAPQLNLPSIGFPLRVLVCLGALLLMLPKLFPGMVSLFAYFLDLLQLKRVSG